MGHGGTSVNFDEVPQGTCNELHSHGLSRLRGNLGTRLDSI